MEQNKESIQNNNLYKKLIKDTFKWIGFSILMGIPIGITVGLFNIILSKANAYRKDNEFLIYFLPLAGILITFMYLKSKRSSYSGENLLKSEVQSAARDIPFYMIFVVFIGSLLTTICGGSAGKESSAIAMGGTFGDFLARKFKLSSDEQRTLIIAGVGSAFGVMYDVPFAGAILGMELVLKGKFHYQALIPSFTTTVIANEVSGLIGSKQVSYPDLSLGNLNPLLIIKLLVLGIIFGIAGFIFNLVLDNSSKVYDLFIKNPYIKAIAGGVITIILFIIIGDDYNGIGESFIRNCFDQRVGFMHSVWKLLFTAVALGSVFQGGRGNPTFFVGAALGSFLSGIFNIPLESSAALGMIGVFCAAASLPITSIAMALEYFGGGEMVSIMIVMTASYIISGFYDIFTKKRIPKEKKMIFKGEVTN